MRPLSPLLAVLLATVAPAWAQSGAPAYEVVNRFGVVDAEAGRVDLRDGTGSITPSWVENGTAVWVKSCEAGPPAGRRCFVRAETPGVAQPFGTVRADDVLFAPPVRPSEREARGVGVPAEFAPVTLAESDGDGALAVGPTVDALNVRAGPSTDDAVVFEAVRGADEVVRLLACAPADAGARGRWCLAEVHPVSDLLDYDGSEARIGFVYTAALVPFVFDGGFE